MRRFIKSFGYALSGISFTARTQLNFRIHMLAILTVTIAGRVLGLHQQEWLWVIVAIGLVLVTELLNTAIEVLVDLVSPGYSEQAGRVKDISAGAVLIAAGIAVVIGMIIFLPKLF